MIYALSNGNGSIKIGKANCVKSRIRSLQTSNPERVEVLATFEGSTPEERALQILLKPYAKSGEWFVDCPAVREAIEAAKKQKTLPRYRRRPPVKRPRSPDPLITQEMIDDLYLLSKRFECASARSVLLKAEIAYVEAQIALKNRASEPLVVGEGE